ncbi:MAG: hypothetical protein AAB539_01610, partial [Patescibacteria group bacterium]
PPPSSDFDIGLVEFDIAVTVRRDGGPNGQNVIAVSRGGIKGTIPGAPPQQSNRLRFSVYIGEKQE